MKRKLLQKFTMVIITMVVLVSLLFSNVQIVNAASFKNTKVKVSSLKNSKNNTAILKFKKVSGAKGYQIVYATNGKFTSGKKIVTTAKLARNLTGLKKGKTYYVKMRAYQYNKKGKKVYSKYSAVKKVKITKGDSKTNKIKLGTTYTGTLKRGDSVRYFKTTFDRRTCIGIKISTYCNKGTSKGEWILGVSDGNLWADSYYSNVDASIQPLLSTKNGWQSLYLKNLLYFTGDYTFTFSVPEYMFEESNYKLNYKITFLQN